MYRNQAAQAVQIDLREFPREACDLTGYIIPDHNQARYGCRVVDRSRRGARLVFDDDILIPDLFMLHLPTEQIKIHCAPVWDNDGTCGVRFISLPETEADGPLDPWHKRSVEAPNPALFGANYSKPRQ